MNAFLWLQHAQILDSALPIGAFSHSFGLETCIAEGHIGSAGDLKTWLEDALRGAWSSSEALLVKGAWTLDAARLWELDRCMDAARVSRETREGTRKMGRSALKLGRAMHPHLDWAPLESAMHSGACAGSWPLVYGVWTHALGLDLDSAATGFLYSCCAAALANAVRLSLIGQTGAQALLSHLQPLMVASWNAVAPRDPFDFSTSLPALEIAQLRHEGLEARLFMS